MGVTGVTERIYERYSKAENNRFLPVPLVFGRRYVTESNRQMLAVTGGYICHLRFVTQVATGEKLPGNSQLLLSSCSQG